MMQKFGEVTRVKIPRDEMTGRSKGIAFATFKTTEDCNKVVDEGFVRYDFYELQVERATMSKQRREQMEQFKSRQDARGDRDREGGGGFRGGRDREGGGYRDREGGFRGGRDRDGGRGGGGYRGGRDRRDEPDSGFLRRNKN